MEFTIEKMEDSYTIKEVGRTIFLCDHSYDDKLLSVYLRNIYGDEVIGGYQIKKWYSTVKPSLALDFTIYEGDTKMGELHKCKGGFEFDYQGVQYQFYGGTYHSKHVIICYDRNHQCAEMVMDDVSTLQFSNGILGPVMALMCILLKEHISMGNFSQDIFLAKYQSSNPV